ncbi:MAG: hypothetical protein RI909_1341 [Bacteroidota bacterium]|jgi:hypothetical protein
MSSIETIKLTLFTNWNLMRWIRLAIGIYLAAQAIQLHDTLSGFVSALFLVQALTNTGCCGVNGCALPATSKKSDDFQEVEYDEIKNKKS